MSEESRSRRILAVAAVWLVLLGGAALLYKLVIAPKKREEAYSSTGTPSRFSSTLRIAHDSFSGYCILRSGALQKRMGAQGLRLSFKDDGGDYRRRIEDLRDGETDLAVFTIDALLRSSAEIDDFPGTIILILDESRGADALVALEKGVGGIDALDHPDARVMVTAGSPSDTLARLVYSQFSVTSPFTTWLEPVQSVEEVFQHLSRELPGSRRAFVLWEPWVSKALAIPGVKALVDSGDFQGYVLDVLVVSRDYLSDERDVVERLVENYLRTAFEIQFARAGGMKRLVLDDAAALGAPLDETQAEELVEKIHWKNTLENYAHFGILSREESKGLQHLEDVVRGIARLLVSTGALPGNPLDGRESWLFHDGILRELSESGFHPGRELRTGAEGLENAAPIRAARELPALSDAQWERLLPIGKLRHDPISFGRGNARLNVSSRRSLEQLSLKLETWPYSYLVVIGHARQEGDPEANRALALQRSQAAAEELQRLGVPPQRLRPITREASDYVGADAQAVSFELVQPSY